MNSIFFFLEMWNCRILNMLKEGDEGAYLLHGNNGRYAQDAIAVSEGTTVYTDVLEIKTPPNSIKINATQCFPGNILAPAKHAKNWLRSKRGIPCNRTGAYITEYNFRMFVAKQRKRW